MRHETLFAWSRSHWMLDLEEKVDNIQDQIGDFIRENKTIRKNQMKMLEMKNTTVPSMTHQET